MPIFQPFRLQWAGRDYVIPADRIMGAIAVVEDVIPPMELMAMMASPLSIKPTRIARAYGAVLRYAGANLSDDAVYDGMFAGGEDVSNSVGAALAGLSDLIMPPSLKARIAAGETPEGNGNRRARRAAARSSKRPTKRPAGRAN